MISNEKKTNRIFLDQYLLHKDNRIRLPKSIEKNLLVIPGETLFDIFFDAENQEIILKKAEMIKIE